MINIIRNKRIILGIFVLCITHVYAQNKLSYLDFLRQVKQYHPLALKANLTREQGSLFVKQARGIYDPILTSKYKEKDYNSKNYYTMFDTDVKWKTITGIQLMGGFGNDQGVYLNPENTTPSGGLGYLGASIPLGKGLFFDENRLLLKGAQQIQNQLNADSEAQFNDLFFKSSESYWNWFASYQILENAKNSVSFAEQRFNLIKIEESVGELSANDTLKAYLQMRDRQVEMLEAQKYYVASYFDLGRWIWDSTITTPDNLIPDQVSINQVQLLASVWSIDNNPKLSLYSSKIAEQQYERRYKIEKLKPKLNFDYSLLYNKWAPSFGGFGKDHLWGLSFEYPLFLRAERAGLKLSDIKIESLELDLANARNELDLKLQNELEQLDLLDSQGYQLSGMVKDYTTLLNFENIKFSMGESTLFELNAWELKLLEGQNKLVKVQSKSALTYSKLFWYSNSWSSLID